MKLINHNVKVSQTQVLHLAEKLFIQHIPPSVENDVDKLGEYAMACFAQAHVFHLAKQAWVTEQFKK